MGIQNWSKFFVAQDFDLGWQWKHPKPSGIRGQMIK